MSDTLTLRVPGREKEAWQKVANAVGEGLSEFARKAVRQRVQAVQAKHGSPWDDLLGGVTVISGRALAVTSEDAATDREIEFTAVPYYAWDNRAPGEMVVWLPEDRTLAEK